MNIYVGNLSWNLKDQDLQNLFAAHGEVSSAKIVLDKFTNRSKGFAFVGMRDQAAAEKAIRELDGSMMEGRTIKVKEAQARNSETKKYF